MPRDHSLLRRACADRGFASHARYHRLATVAVAFPCDRHQSGVLSARATQPEGTLSALLALC